MFSYYFITTLFFVLITCQHKETLIFKNELLLSNCVETFLLTNFHQYVQHINAKEISDLVAKRFRGKIITRIALNKRLHDFIYGLRSGRISSKISRDQLTNEFRIALKEALEHCVANSSNIAANIVLESVEAKNADVASTNENVEYIVFGSETTALAKCIENHLLYYDWELHNNKFAETFAKLAAKRFSGKIIKKKDFNRRISYFFYHLRNKKTSHQLKWNQIKNEINFQLRLALEDCVNRTTEQSPIIISEPPELAIVLNFMLVSWSNDLRNMIQSRDGRVLLRKYANDAQMALECALKIYQDFDIFRSIIRVLWMCRIQKIFNENNIEHLYLTYRYIFNNSTIPAEKNIYLVLNRKDEQNFVDRNKLVPQTYINRILSIHSAYRYSQDSFDIFEDYSENGMSSAEYYLENHIIEFYRILFFFLELESRGIRTDEDDTYDGPLPHDVIPEHLQAIIYNDDSYREYLLDERLLMELLVGSNTQNLIVQHLIGTSRVYEEDLVMLKLNNPSKTGTRFSSSTSAINSTTIARTGSTTPQYQHFNKRGNVWKNNHDKYFSKHLKLTPAESPYHNSDENSNNKSYETFRYFYFEKDLNHFVTNSSDKNSFFFFVDNLSKSHRNFKTKNKYNGYITNDNDFKQFQSFCDEPLAFNKTLKYVFEKKALK